MLEYPHVHIDAHLGILMFVFRAAGDGEPKAFALVNADAKSALPWDHYVVLAGRVAGAQLTGIGGCMKPTSGSQQRILLLLPLACDANGDVATSLQLLDSGESAIEILHDVRACFPTLVRKLAYDSDESDEESDEDEQTKHERETRKKAKVAAVQTTPAQTHSCMTRVKTLESIEGFFQAYQVVDSEQVQAAICRDLGLAPSARCALLCVDLCIDTPSQAPSVPATEELNFGLIFAHAIERASGDFLTIPMARVPSKYFPSDSDLEEQVFQDATVYSFGARREATAHGGGKSSEEMVKNIRMRHASGTFCTLVLPTMAWENVVTKHAANMPRIRELQGELRQRRILGMAPNDQTTKLHLLH